MSFQDYKDFEKLQNNNRKTVKLAGQVHPSDRNRVLKIRGLPYQVSEDDICHFFKEYKVKPADTIIESFNGKKTGYALVFFGSERDA